MSSPVENRNAPQPNAPTNMNQYIFSRALLNLYQQHLLDSDNFINALQVVSRPEVNDDVVIRFEGEGLTHEVRGWIQLKEYLIVNIRVVLDSPDICGSSTSHSHSRPARHHESRGTVQPQLTNWSTNDNIDAYLEGGYKNDDNDKGFPLKEGGQVFKLCDVEVVVFDPTKYQVIWTSEICLGIDKRSACLSADVQDGGDYSGIVMVVAFFKHARNTISAFWGSGTVIDDNIVLTAAHNIYHREYGIAVAITIYRDYRADPDHTDYYHVDSSYVPANSAKSYLPRDDFAILHVERLFSNKVKRMPYVTTPIEMQIQTTVYSIARDLEGFEGQSTVARSNGDAKYDLNRGTVLHNGSTVKGASGGPLVNERDEVIGVHRGWHENKLTCEKTNEAVAIGLHGNDAGRFIEVARTFHK